MMRPLILISLFFCTFRISAQEVIMPAEFEKNEGILLKWNYNASVDSTVTRIASIISPDDKVWMLYDPANPITLTAIQAQLSARGANLANITFMEGVAENPWLRDYGPLAGYFVDATSETRHLVDAQYNAGQSPSADFLPFQLAMGFNYDYDVMPLNFEGGNLLLDGIGRGFVSDRVLTQNPDKNKYQVIQTIYTKLSLNETIILPSVPECGGGEWSELSRLVKIIDSETVLVSQFPASVPYYNKVELLADSLSKTFNDVGRYFKVYRLPVATNDDGNYATSNSGVIRSYTSALVINNKILIPYYNKPTDAVALNVYRQVFPGYHLYQVPAQVLADMHGSLYRLAVNIPQSKLFRIRHSKMIDMKPFENEVWINTFVQCVSSVDSIQLYYRIHPSPVFLPVITFGCCGGYSAAINGYSIGDTVSYYLKAFQGNFSNTLPIAAPETIYTFWFDPFTGLKTVAKEEVSVFPNPNRGIVFIQGIKQFSADATYQVTNLGGMRVAEGRISSDAVIHLPDYLNNGFYIIKLVNSGKTSVSKLYLHR